MKANAALYERSFSHLKKSNSASHAVLALVVVDGQHTSINAINYIVRSNERHSEVRPERLPLPGNSLAQRRKTKSRTMLRRRDLGEGSKVKISGDSGNSCVEAHPQEGR